MPVCLTIQPDPSQNLSVFLGFDYPSLVAEDSFLRYILYGNDSYNDVIKEEESYYSYDNDR